MGELLTWARRAKSPANRLQVVLDLLAAALIDSVDVAVAEKFGEVRAGLFDRGVTVGEMDVLNAAVALIHNLTLVTHNTKDYAKIPGLSLADWLVP